VTTMETPGAVTPGAPEQDISTNQNNKDLLNSQQSQTPDNGPSTLLTPEEHAVREDRLKAALEYAALGFEVFPLSHVLPDGTCSVAGTPHCKCNGNPEHAGKCQVLDHWDQEATTDEAMIRSWWAPSPPYFPSEGTWSSKGQIEPPQLIPILESWYPLANIGLSLRNSGIWCLDVDPRHDGDESLEKLAANGLKIPATRIHRTGRNGRHFFFRAPEDIGPRNFYADADGIADGIDLIGKGFAFAPPSVMGTGSYSVKDSDPVGELPDYVADWIRNRKAQFEGRPAAGAPQVAPDGRRRRYAEAALAGEKKTLATCQDGRNNQLNRSAMALGTLSEACSISQDEAYLVLHEACETNGLNAEDGDGQFYATFMSGWNAGLRNPRHPAYQTVGLAQLRPWDQFGNAERLVDLFGDVLSWNMTDEVHVVYANGVWNKGDRKSAFRYARRMIAAMTEDEALSYPDDDADPESKDKQSTRERFLEFAAKCRTRAEAAAAAELALTYDAFCCKAEDFDRDPMVINFPNGTLDVRTGTFTEGHNPQVRHAMMAGASYNPDARCPKFMAFLEEMQPDPDMRAYLQRVMGYSLTGSVAEQKLWLHDGDGGNGKSVFFDVLAATAGSYHQAVPVQTLTLSRGESSSGLSPDVARMKGKRFLTASETKSGHVIDEELVKKLTGGDVIAARGLWQEFADFRPTGKIHLGSNHLLHVSRDKAIWRRLRRIVWAMTPAVIIGDLPLIIIAEELAGVLNWLADGAIQWAKEGLGEEPASVIQGTLEYKFTSDKLMQFAEDVLIGVDEISLAGQGGDVLTPHKDSYIRRHYLKWCEDQGHLPIKDAQTLYKELAGSTGIKYTNSNGFRGFRGLRVDIRKCDCQECHLLRSVFRPLTPQ
jgi:P4 family phage/plasmid primase-like protien